MYLEKKKDFFLGGSSESPSNEEFVMVGEEIEPAVFQLCGETQEDLNEARDMIFTKEDVEILNGMQREFTIKVQLEKKGQDSVVTLEGLTRDVHSAESRIRDMIRKVERNENRRREAFIISSVVQWQYQENGHSIKNFDTLINYDLEKAFQNRQPSVKIKINNDEYDADLVRKRATRGRLRIELNRLDLQGVNILKFRQLSRGHHVQSLVIYVCVLVHRCSTSSKFFAFTLGGHERTVSCSCETRIRLD